jgi:pimeloyl-ACP methyl ester carboxylesterase
MDLQGHGRTADIDRPMTCEQHADDIATLLKHLKIEEADFFGDSFGGTITVMMTVRHPKLVRRVVSHGGSLAPFPQGTDADQTPDSDFVKWQREEYQKVAPDPKQWPRLFDKVIKGTLGRCQVGAHPDAWWLCLLLTPSASSTLTFGRPHR